MACTDAVLARASRPKWSSSVCCLCFAWVRAQRGMAVVNSAWFSGVLVSGVCVLSVANSGHINWEKPIVDEPNNLNNKPNTPFNSHRPAKAQAECRIPSSLASWLNLVTSALCKPLPQLNVTCPSSICCQQMALQNEERYDLPFTYCIVSFFRQGKPVSREITSSDRWHPTPRYEPVTEAVYCVKQLYCVAYGCASSSNRAM